MSWAEVKNIKDYIKEKINDKVDEISNTYEYDFMSRNNSLSEIDDSKYSCLKDLVSYNGSPNAYYLTNLSLKNVTAITPSNYSNYIRLSSVSLPNVTHNLSFYNCTELKDVTLNAITRVSFTSCPKLSSVSLSNATYGYFSNCTNLDTVTLSNTATGGYFGGCVNLREIKGPTWGEPLSASTFYNCKRLSKIDTNILYLNAFRSSVFYNCELLSKTVSFTGSVSISGNMGNPFYNCPNLKIAGLEHITSIYSDVTQPFSAVKQCLSGDVTFGGDMSSAWYHYIYCNYSYDLLSGTNISSLHLTNMKYLTGNNILGEMNKLTTLYAPNTIVSGGTALSYPQLTSLYVSSFYEAFDSLYSTNWSSVYTISMFLSSHCPNLREIAGSMNSYAYYFMSVYYSKGLLPSLSIYTSLSNRIYFSTYGNYMNMMKTINIGSTISSHIYDIRSIYDSYIGTYYPALTRLNVYNTRSLDIYSYGLSGCRATSLYCDSYLSAIGTPTDYTFVGSYAYFNTLTFNYSGVVSISESPSYIFGSRVISVYVPSSRIANYELNSYWSYYTNKFVGI